MRWQNETSDEMAKETSDETAMLYARATGCKASMLHTKNDKTKLKLKGSWGGSW